MPYFWTYPLTTTQGEGWGGWVLRHSHGGGYHPKKKKKNHIITFVFQDQTV